jgi:hypothetical protein
MMACMFDGGERMYAKWSCVRCSRSERWRGKRGVRDSSIHGQRSSEPAKGKRDSQSNHNRYILELLSETCHRASCSFEYCYTARHYTLLDKTFVNSCYTIR